MSSEKILSEFFWKKIPVAIFRLSQDGKVVDANEFLLRLVGLKNVDLAINFLDEDQTVLPRKERRTILRNLLKGEEKVTINNRQIKKPGGKMIFANMTFFVDSLSDSGQNSFWGIVEDFSEIAFLKNKLRYRDDLFSSVVNSMPFELWVFDKNRKILAQSRYSIEKWGSYEDKYVSDFPLKLGVEEEREWMYDKVLTGEAFDGIERIENAGQTKFFHRILAPLKQNNSITGVVAILFDETEKIMAGHRADEIHDFLETILDAVPVRIFWKNTELQFVGGNASFLEDLGYESEIELHGKTDYDLLMEEDADFYKGLYIEVLKTRKPILNLKMWLQIPGAGKRYIMASVIPYFSASGSIEGVLGCYQDITRMKQLEDELMLHKENLEQLVDQRTTEIHQLNEELISSNDELQVVNEMLVNQKQELENTLEKLKVTQGKLIKSEKMASLGVLTAGIAHEMNNPLNFISSGMHGLEQVVKEIHQYTAGEGFEDEVKPENNQATVESLMSDLKSLMGAIENGVNRTTNIVKGLRVFSRMDEEVKSRADIHEIIESALVILKNKYKHRIAIHKNFETLPLIMCFPGKLSQVMVNLLMNAIQAIQREGNITIETGWLKRQKQISVRITDDGAGIPAELQKKIFDPFFTTKSVNEGTGMGLALVESMIKDHDGEISFTSRERDGASFKIILPQK
ncbi:ATP-binding protein [Marinilabilia rubra]|uniref:histidine kinase n=1 Tax=Marinilabilia rubra TaxID=2162893 RepID=A0A2U2B9Z7_9BACT|nr:ATP-binding protein [Marinilabilia rubra]PWD99877.1 hypothetical protein DDZ16_08275 [Marinilabilia rubra]